MVKDLQFASFYLLPKIQMRLDNVLGRPVISKRGYYTKNISSFLGLSFTTLSKTGSLLI